MEFEGDNVTIRRLQQSGKVTPLEGFDRFMVMTVIFIVWITGVYALGCTMYVMLKRHPFSNSSFGMIATFQCGNCLILLTHLSWWMISLGIWRWDEVAFEIDCMMGWFTFLFNSGFLLATHILSICRLFNIMLPMSNLTKTINKKSFGIAVNVFCGTVAAIYFSFFAIYRCDTYIDSISFNFGVAQRAHCKDLKYYGDYLLPMFMYIVGFLIDLFTCFHLKKYRESLQSIMIQAKVDKKYSREKLMCIQTLANTSMYLSLLVCFYIVPYLITMPFILHFIFAHFMWTFILASYGYAPIVLNREVRRFIFSSLCSGISKSTTMTAVTSTTSSSSTNNAPRA